MCKITRELKEKKRESVKQIFRRPLDTRKIYFGSELTSTVGFYCVVLIQFHIFRIQLFVSLIEKKERKKKLKIHTIKLQKHDPVNDCTLTAKNLAQIVWINIVYKPKTL